ncbi:MAG: Ig-like domain-containing protein [Caldilineaceae bacterium]
MSRFVSQFYRSIAILIALSLLPIFPPVSLQAAEPRNGQTFELTLHADSAPQSNSNNTTVAADNALFPLLVTGSTQVIQITDAGFSPATLTVFGPSDITWVNATNITQTLQSGAPSAPSNKVYLPVIQRGGANALATAANYLDLLMQQADNAPTFSATLPPGQSFTYHYLKAGTYSYYLSNAAQFEGKLTLNGVGLIRTSPNDGDNDVAVTRETILEFSDALDANSVTAAAFLVTVGNSAIDYRLNLSEDKTRVTLFYKDDLPASARVRVLVDGSKLKDSKGNAVDVDGDAAAGGTELLEFDTLSLTVLPGTSVCGRVFASELAVNASNVSVNTPLKGATVTVDGMEASLRTTSDANGNFCLNPAPLGRFFVHIDGRTVTQGVPQGAYYPFVGKAWESVAGKQTSVGDVFLPLVPAGTLQSVSANQNTQITFPDSVVQQHPDLQGVSILVPANSLFSDDGSRGGKVGIAPVPPDRLPGKLPEGLEFPVVITVQTDGAGNFDQPAPVCFPNLPDPNTGKKLAPGAKDALYSYNHDAGKWSVVGSMTVSADGQVVCSDPGTGILAPGWHGNGPPPKQPPPPPPPCNNPGAANKCNQRCSEDAVRCIAYCTAAGEIAVLACITAGPAVLACVIAAVAAGTLCDAACVHNGVVCQDRCQEDNCTVDRQGGEKTSQIFPVLPNLSFEEDPIVAQIKSIQDQIQQLVYPYAMSGQSLPQDKLDQMNALLAQADEVAGGDAVAYLNDYILQKELEAAPIEGEMGYSPGNVPPYPVLYMAEIMRPNGPLRIRGKTEANGQYSIFVPRDGQLLYVSFYDPQTNAWGVAYPRVNPNAPYELPNFTLKPVDSTFPDFDQDALPDVVEFIYGTDPGKADTDGDGIDDSAEIAQGSDPLGGLTAQTGIIATGDTPGKAVDVCVQNNLAVVADSEAGVSFFNVFDVANPLLVAQVDTPGIAKRVACGNNRVAVADGDSGLALIDISNVATARIASQIALSDTATAVAVAGKLAYVGTAGNQIVIVDLQSGAKLGQVTMGEGIQDLRVNGDYLYALTTAKLYSFLISKNLLIAQNSADAPGTVGAGGRLWRLFAGDGLAYATHSKGYDTFDLSQPGSPQLIAAGNTTQFGWKQLISNGSGLGVAAVGANSTDDGAHDISLYDISDPAQTNQFLTTFTTPGLAAALTLYNGRAFVADSLSGMQIINYLEFDSKGISPTISLSSNFAAGVAEAGTTMRVTANISDDVQVRNVEFYVDGVLTATVGSFPFEFRFTTPRLSEQASFTLRARANDTGGNSAWSTLQTINLVQDATPPQVLSVSPAPNSLGQSGTITNIVASFSEAIAPATVNGTSFKLFRSGPDGLPGTGDDVPIVGTVSVKNSTQAVLQLAAALPADRYHAILQATITDGAGNPLPAAYGWDFTLFPQIALNTVISGTISEAGEFDYYRLNAAPGQQVYFQLLSHPGLTFVAWKLIDATGAILFDRCFGCGADGTVTLSAGGTYTVAIGNKNTAETGSYSFELWNVPAPQRFATAIGNTVSNGVPSAGAGAIESPAALDIYTFTATAGQQVYFDLINHPGLTFIAWRLTDKTGATLLDQCFGCGAGGTVTLAAGGIYTLTVGNQGVSEMGTYSFKLWNVPAPGRFAIAVGDTVSNGVPGPGAGVIESPGTIDIYTFTAAAGQQVFFELLNHPGLAFVNWRLTDKTGATLLDQCFGCGAGGTVTLAAGGVYTLSVGNSGVNETGSYSFKVWNVPAPQRFAIAIGDTISNGVPGPGAGAIESPGAFDVYTFTANAGQQVTFDLLSQTGVPFVSWRLVDPSGTTVFNTCFGCGEPGTFTLTASGVYTLSVGNAGDAESGTYSFKLVPVVARSDPRLVHSAESKYRM